MACIRKRRGKWAVDYRDPAGIRRWVTCETRREAEGVLGDKVREARGRTRPAVDPDITLSAYAERWLAQIAAHAKPRTVVNYGKVLRVHVLPALGSLKVRHIYKGHVKDLLALRTASGRARNTVLTILAVIRALLSAAVDDES